MISVRHLSVVGLAGAALVAAACNTNVENPDVVKASNVGTAATLPVQFAGAYSDFAIAYVGTGLGNQQIDNQAQEGHVLVTGMFSDEFRDADYFTNHIQLDTRTNSRDNFTLDDYWRIIHRARLSNDNTAAAYAKFDSTNTNRLTVLALSGYSYVLLAEAWCGNVPISTTDASGTVHYAPPISTDSLLHIAESRFQQVLALAPIDSAATGDVTNIDYEVARANVGLARALLDEGQFTAAATAAANVPDGFTDSIERSNNSPNEQNGIYYYTNQDIRYAATSGKGSPVAGTANFAAGLGVGLNYTIDGINGDPRIFIFPLTITGQTDDGSIDTVQQAYPQYTTSVPLASSIESQLIQAEAALQGGLNGAALTHINAARHNWNAIYGSRGTIVDLGALPTDSTAVDTLFAERAYDLWLTGHRMYDMRRLIRTKNMQGGYGRTLASVWATGQYWKTGPNYGNQVSFLIPLEEDNNPMYTDAGCNQGLTP